MLRIVFLGGALLALAVPAAADELTPTQYFEKYGGYMPRAIIAERMEQLFNLLPAEKKAIAAPILKQDLRDHFGGIRAGYQEHYMDVVEAHQADVEDTSLEGE